MTAGIVHILQKLFYSKFRKATLANKNFQIAER